MNIVVYLHGNADTVAFSNTKAAREHDIVLDMILLNCLLEKLYDILRSLKMTG